MHTEAWVLERGDINPVLGKLKQKLIVLDMLAEDEILVEPIFGCWEGNMTHALQRYPIDIARRRGEAEVVLGNSGVVRVLKPGSLIKDFSPGDFAVVRPVDSWDEAGYPLKIWAYDAPKTVGLLARQTKVKQHHLFKIPSDSAFSLRQWAAFSLRYPTAWDNWQVAFGSWQLQMASEQLDLTSTKISDVFVWAWGGGVSFAELTLAQQSGCKTFMAASTDQRLLQLKDAGITPIDRREFPDLAFDPKQFATDYGYRKRYMQSELKFLDTVKHHTQGKGVSIFIDNLGGGLQRATLNALGRQGVLTTTGWKTGVETSTSRAAACINRHIFVHTHAAHLNSRAHQHALDTNWMAPEPQDIYNWDEIPELADNYENGRIDSYFPIYQVNPI